MYEVLIANFRSNGIRSERRASDSIPIPQEIYVYYLKRRRQLWAVTCSSNMTQPNDDDVFQRPTTTTQRHQINNKRCIWCVRRNFRKALCVSTPAMMWHDGELLLLLFVSSCRWKKAFITSIHIHSKNNNIMYNIFWSTILRFVVLSTNHFLFVLVVFNFTGHMHANCIYYIYIRCHGSKQECVARENRKVYIENIESLLPFP